MKKNITLMLLLSLTAILLTGLPGCKNDDDTEPSTAYYGDWMRPLTGDTVFDTQLSFFEDNTFAWVPLTAESGHTTTTGTFTASRNTITLAGDPDCPGSGEYHFSYNNGVLNLDVVSDDCNARISGLIGDWQMKDRNAWAALVGKWSRKITYGDSTFDALLTIGETGAFKWEKLQPVTELQNFSGRLAATLTDMIFYNDDHCHGNGYYSYNINQLQLTIGFVNDGCELRTPALIGTWQHEE